MANNATIDAPASETTDSEPISHTGTDGNFTPDFMAEVFKGAGVKQPEQAAAKTEAQKKIETDAAAAEEAKKRKEGKTQAELEAEAEALLKAEDEGEGKTDEEIKAAEDAAEAEAEAQAEEEAVAATQDEAGKETADVIKAKLKDLPEAQRKIVQSVIDERIGKISAKSKSETERLGSRVVELTTELEATRRQAGAPIVVPGVHSLFLVETPEQIDAYADTLDTHEDLLERVKETGIEADETKGIAGFTPEQVRFRLREIRKERERTLPQARALLLKRAESAAELKAKFPALYDATTEEYRTADALRKQLPELRRFPDADVFIAKFVLGTKVFAAAAKTATSGRRAAQAAPGAKKIDTPVQRRAPRAPGDGSGALGSVLDDASRRRPDANAAIKTYVKTGDRDDLENAVKSLLFR